MLFPFDNSAAKAPRKTSPAAVESTDSTFILSTKYMLPSTIDTAPLSPSDTIGVIKPCFCRYAILFSASSTVETFFPS